MKYLALCFVLLVVTMGLLFAEETKQEQKTAEFSTNEYVTMFKYGQENPGPYDLDAGIMARAPRLCKKPFVLPLEQDYYVSIDRKPVAGLKPLLEALAPFKVLGVTFRAQLEKQEFALLSSLSLVRKLEFHNQSFDSADISNISQLETVQELSFSSCTFPAANASTILARLPVLEKLSLYECKNQKALLAEITRLKALKSIALESNELTDAMLANLQKCTLEELKIISDGITDEVFSQHSFLKSLKVFSLGGKQLTGKSIKFVGNMPRLRELEIWGMKEVARYLDSSETIPLKRLSIAYTDLTDRDYFDFLKLFSAEELELVNNTELIPMRRSSVTGYLKCTYLNVDVSECPDNLVVNPSWQSGVGLVRARIKKKCFSENDFMPVGSGSNRRYSDGYFPASGTQSAKTQTVRYIGRFPEPLFLRLALRAPDLLELELSNSQFKGSAGDEALQAISKITKLRKLQVGQVGSTNFGWISALSELHLSYLKLCDVKAVSDDTIAQFTEFKLLRQLDLRGNPSLTAAGITKLAGMENLVCFNPTPCELIEEHENAVRQLLQQIQQSLEETKRNHGTYPRNGMVAFTNVETDIRAATYGYTFKYSSNSNVDDATEFELTAVPNSPEDGETSFKLTPQGISVMR